MIEVFKITHEIYDQDVSLKLVYHPNSNTRGNNYKLLNQSFHYDARKYCFSARIVNIWNSLPNDVVDVKGVLQSKKWISQNYTRRVVYLYTSYFG